MKNIILGLIGLIWGGLILFRYFTTESVPTGNANYETGRGVGVVLGGLFFIAGGLSLVRGLTAKGKDGD